METRTEWTDGRLNDLARRVNGIPEKVAAMAYELQDIRNDIAAIRAMAEKETNYRQKETSARETNTTARTVAFITAGAAIFASLLSSVALLVTQL